MAVITGTDWDGRADYLEQKKKAFARFYFVSNQALLDILANGNDPIKVCYYLGDCFDGIKMLDFQKDPVHARVACGMFSKEDEYVPFGEDYHLEGPVETVRFPQLGVRVERVAQG
ncbi:dynein heavy chain family protein [Toxoplasma gondii p89]|uniref:Dynein heavy chain family protein n=1 Tax=Toxoplasma gondii p89 TaxID=943119 RepID=A0A086KNR9_TOXGO|nr:dynein heavy chain family protein [Toxoplasma gondii p89]